MKQERLEIRIDKEQKDKLSSIANRLNISTSKLVTIHIQKLINSEHYEIKNNIDKNNDISINFMEMYQLLENEDFECKDIILKKLGDLECLI